VTAPSIGPSLRFGHERVSLIDSISRLPVALRATYVTPAVNTPVTLYDGPVEFDTGGKIVAGQRRRPTTRCA